MRSTAGEGGPAERAPEAKAADAVWRFEPPPGTPRRFLPLYEVDDRLLPLYEEIADCPRCALARTRSRTVPGSGPADARILFVGEGPGQREDELGLPFVGRAGQFLDELLASIGLSRTDVYVCNVVKCRPPGNRDPLPEELAACADYLERQIAIVDPEVIVTLGRFSMARWFPGERISRIHGQPKRLPAAEGRRERVVIPMYHPAAALRDTSLREVMREDFARIPGLLAGGDAREAVPLADAPATPPPGTADRPEPPRTERLL